jgi:hypothetical protein
MALPVRLITLLGGKVEDLREEHLQAAVDREVPEGPDLDWKRDYYTAADAGKKELAKDVCAMANTGGGLITIGINDAGKDHASELAPLEIPAGRGEEWIQSVLATWVQPVITGVTARRVRSDAEAGREYMLIAVPRSPVAPHAVGQPGNDFNFRVHVRHGTTTRTLSESEIAQRYRDRFAAATADIDHLERVRENGHEHLRRYAHRDNAGGRTAASIFPAWITMTAVPTVRGSYPLATQGERRQAMEQFAAITRRCATDRVNPSDPVLAGRRQVRFEGSVTGQLHEDGSSYLASVLWLNEDQRGAPEPQLLYSSELELPLLTQVEAAASWADMATAGGDLMLSVQLHRLDGAEQPVRVALNADTVFQHGPVGVLPKEPASVTADLAALAADHAEAVITAHSIAADLLADLGLHQPGSLTPSGELDRSCLSHGWRAMLEGWPERRTR